MFSVVPVKDALLIASGLNCRSGAVNNPNLKDTKKRLQDVQRNWLNDITKTTGLKLSQVATRAGISDSTLSRLVNDPNYRGTLSPLTIERIKESLRVQGPGEEARRSPLASIAFAEAERVELSNEPPAIAAALGALIAGREHIEVWRLKTEALLAIGLWPGDLALVDPNVNPQPQDAVCVTIQDWARGAAETIWRIFDPPFLVAAAASRDRTIFKPILVDNERVQIRGVVVESLRPRQVR